MRWMLLAVCAVFCPVQSEDFSSPSSSSGQTQHATPHFMWSQTFSTVRLVIKVPSPHRVRMEWFPPDRVLVRADSGVTGRPYRLKLQLYAAVDGLDSEWEVAQNKQSVELLLPKSSEAVKPWPRLLQSRVAYRTHMSVDWDHWVNFEEEALNVLMRKRFQSRDASDEEHAYFKVFEEWVRESGLIDEDDDLDAAIEDLWREKLEKQEAEYLEYQNVDIIRKDLHSLLKEYPHGSNLSQMTRRDRLRLEHLMYQYDRLHTEADQLRESGVTESGMFENHLERQEIQRRVQEARRSRMQEQFREAREKAEKRREKRALKKIKAQQSKEEL